MKKNLKIVSLAAAALLAVSPIVASSANVNADTGLGGTTSQSSNTNTNTNEPFFSYDFGEPITNKGTMPEIDASGFKTIQNITDAINKNITFSPNGSNGANHKENISNAEVYRQLRSQNITAKAPAHFSKPSGLTQEQKYGEYTFNVPANFHITLLHTINGTGYTVTVPFYNNSNGTVTPDATAPVFKVKVGSADPVKVSGNAYYTIAAGSNFNPISFTEMDGNTVTFSADQASNNTTAASVTVASNSDSVDTSQTGRFFTVRLTATNQAGKTSHYSYTVLVVANGLQPLHANGQSSIATYSIYGNSVSTNSTTFKDGQQVYVGNTTRTVNNVSYTKVSTKSKADADSGNLWVQTSALAAQTPSETTETHRVMIDSRAYDKNGNYLGHIYSYNTNINIVPTVVTINGKTYYKVAGKDEYVRVTNITGTPRRVRHNAYVYRSSYRRNWTGKIKYYRGETVHTYGAAFTFKNGKRYYRIDGCSPSNKRYIKAANF